MNTSYIDEDGLENVAVGVIKQAKKDYIKGAKLLYSILKYVPEYENITKSIYNDLMGYKKETIRWMLDAWSFIKNDPYNMFGEAGEEDIIKQWTNDAINDYYKILYLKGASILFKKHITKKDMNNDDIIKNLINDEQITSNFISARNYAHSLSYGEELIREWNIKAFNNARHLLLKNKEVKPKNIKDTDHLKTLMSKREKNINIAKKLYSEGLSKKEISEKMGLTTQCIRNYLRS